MISFEMQLKRFVSYSINYNSINKSFLDHILDRNNQPDLKIHSDSFHVHTWNCLYFI